MFKGILIDNILKESLKLLRSSIPTTIEIDTQIEPECGLVFADPTEIHQVILNLCTNAYHAMREHGGVMTVILRPVDITSEDSRDSSLKLPPGSYVNLEVSDTGHGMEPAVLERIFEPYYTTKGIGEGTGLGLAVTHGIVTKSGVMVGLGETVDEVLDVMRDLRELDVDILTIGQYLQPTRQHAPIDRYYAPKEFKVLREQGYRMGFRWVESNPLVRSSYNAEAQVQMLSCGGTDGRMA